MANDYISIAKTDREWVDYLISGGKDKGNFNPAVVQCQQVAEKYLKGYIDEYLNFDGVFDKQLKSHNLRLLAGIINEKTGVGIDLRDAKYLGDFYFDARYPGDNYMLIKDVAIAEECKGICDDIISKIDSLIESRFKSGTVTEFFGAITKDDLI